MTVEEEEFCFHGDAVFPNVFSNAQNQIKVAVFSSRSNF